jgi:hypothetical protein
MPHQSATTRRYPASYASRLSNSALDEAQAPKMSDYERWLGAVEITPVPVPYDCSDGFLYAYWRRPHAYLDRHIRSGSSSFFAIGEAAEAGLQDLRRDLETGEWERRYGGGRTRA